MTENKSPTDIKSRILSRIKSGDVEMHSHSYFTLKLAALTVVSLLALVVSVLLLTFILFTIRINIFHPHGPFAPGALFFFTHFFPWHLLLLDVLLVASAEWLLRSFRFAYQRPVLFVLFMLLALALASAMFIDRQGFNDVMLDRSHHQSLPPPFNDMYQHAHHTEMDLF